MASAMGHVAHATERDLSEYMALRQAPLSSSQRRLTSSLRAMAALVRQQGALAVRRLLPHAMPLSNEGVIDVYVYTDVLTQAEIDALQHHSVRLYHAESTISHRLCCRRHRCPGDDCRPALRALGEFTVL